MMAQMLALMNGLAPAAPAAPSTPPVTPIDPKDEGDSSPPVTPSTPVASPPVPLAPGRVLGPGVGPEEASAPGRGPVVRDRG